jgi:NADH-quinone oxidoreductase subunit L
VLAYLLFGPQRERKPAENVVERLWLAGWGFDWIYNGLFVVPFQWLTRKLASDPADLPVQGIAQATNLSYRALRSLQTGQVRWYATGLAMGTVVILAIAFFTR